MVFCSGVLPYSGDAVIKLFAISALSQADSSPTPSMLISEFIRKAFSVF